jgi:Secretion system C-terminal sorting domain/Cytosolic carboxypeptidase N-terminal domain
MKLNLLFFLFITSVCFSQIKFDANFESGNLASVSTSDSVYFNLTTSEDIGGRWFYYRISGVKDKFIKVNVSNSDANRPMYSYDNENFIRFTESESPSRNYFEKAFDEDTVYVAYYTPYTFSYLQSRIKDWQKSDYTTVDTLGYTEHNLPVQEMILTDKSVPDDNKFKVWIHARTHPGETPSSWHFDGIIQELLKDHASINFYRKNIVFYLYPFNNPEGVYYGRSRSNFYGIDQERDWNKSDDETSSAVLLLKNRMKEINSDKVLSIALNLHSQASPYPTFWIHTASSTSDYFYRREYQFSNLTISDLPYFVQSDYRESNLQNYFPEGFMWANYGDQILALTYETPYDHYSNGVWVTNENLFEFGATTVYGIAEFLELSAPERLIIDNKNATTTSQWVISQSGVDFYGDDFYHINAGNGENIITYESEKTESGIYDVFAWWTANSGNSSSTKFILEANNEENIIEKSQQVNGGQWNYLSDISLYDSTTIKIYISDDADGTVVADAIRIIYRGPTTTVANPIIVETFELYQNYPNPFNPTTTIRFRLKQSENVKIIVFNSLGETVETIMERNLSEGTHEVIFNSSNKNLSSGIYYYQLITDSYSQTKGMILLK